MNADSNPVGSSYRPAASPLVSDPVNLLGDLRNWRSMLVQSAERRMSQRLLQTMSPEDVAHEVLLRAWQDGCLKKAESPWVLMWRLRKFVAGMGQKLSPEMPFEGRVEELPGDSTDDPVWAAMAQEDRDCATWRYRGLPRRSAIILELREKGVPLSEVSKRVGISDVAARRALSRARNQIRQDSAAR